jgi:hypothetical protein
VHRRRGGKLPRASSWAPTLPAHRAGSRGTNGSECRRLAPLRGLPGLDGIGRLELQVAERYSGHEHEWRAVAGHREGQADPVSAAHSVDTARFARGWAHGTG